MPTLYAEIEIDRPRSRVWQVLTDKAHWAQWNTFLFDCDRRQPLQIGQELWLAVQRQLGEETTEFWPIVTVLQPPTVLQWRAAIPGFCNQHSFELIDLGQSRTRYRHQQQFSGWMSRWFLLPIRQPEHRGMRRMAGELKRYVEAGR